MCENHFTKLTYTVTGRDLKMIATGEKLRSTVKTFNKNKFLTGI